jgi:CheY-like chemotaxis protein
MKCILIINASPELLRVLSTSIENEGYKAIVRTYTVIEDMHEIQELKPDLILLDILAGGSSNIGWKILERLKQSGATQSIPIIISTADLREVKQRQDFLSAQAITVILKPFNNHTLLEAIRKSISK